MIELLLVLAGVHLMIEWLAAFYRIVDLWYDIKRYWPAILTRLGIITGLGLVTITLLPSASGHYFAIGAISYLLVHLGVWLIGRLIAFWLENRSF